MKIKRIIIFLFIILSIFILNINKSVYAYDQNDHDDVTGIVQRGKDFIDLGENHSTIEVNQTYNGFEEIAGLLFGIGIFIAVAVGMIIGIKFFLSTPEGKAEYKQLLTPYIIGVVLIVGALTIWKIVVNALSN